MDGKCMIGQVGPCGLPAAGAIATAFVADTVWLTRPEEVRRGGVVLLCHKHLTTPIADWD